MSKTQAARIARCLAEQQAAANEHIRQSQRNAAQRRRGIAPGFVGPKGATSRLTASDRAAAAVLAESIGAACADSIARDIADGYADYE